MVVLTECFYHFSSKRLVKITILENLGAFFLVSRLKVSFEHTTSKKFTRRAFIIHKKKTLT